MFWISTILFLTDVVRNEENQVSGRCQSEMNAHRKMLMDDYNISPEVVAKCAKDIQVRKVWINQIRIYSFCFKKSLLLM